jgi:hypothetical protein
LLITNIAFVVTNNIASGQLIINPTGRTATTLGQTTVGDLSFTRRFLLHETPDFWPGSNHVLNWFQQLHIPLDVEENDHEYGRPFRNSTP